MTGECGTDTVVFGPTGSGERMFDWTNGCIAVTNADMDEIWHHVPEGVSIEIRP